MHIEEVTNDDSGSGEEELTVACVQQREIGVSNAKRSLIGVGARVLFYPTLLYNVLRNKIEPKFRWWDEVEQFILLGAVPFPTDVPRLKQLGVEGVITLNEPYETLVPTSLYLAYGINHLMIPTRDYLFAPSHGDICRAVNFIHNNASCGKTTYVHCKAGRGRSTTIVLCYLVRHKGMTPKEAYEHVRLSRPRVLLAATQWQAVQEYYYDISAAKIGRSIYPDKFVAARSLPALDDGSIVVVTESDLDGYEESRESSIVENGIWAELSVVYRVQFAGQAALARISCLWIRCHAGQKMMAPEKLHRESCSVEADHLAGLGVDIPVY